MPIANVQRLAFFTDTFYFDHKEGHFRFDQFQAIHDFEPQGVNWYVGLNSHKKQQVDSQNAASGQKEGLAQWDILFLNDFRDWFLSGEEQEKNIIFALEPSDSNTFHYVAENLEWVDAIARQLKGYADQIAAQGKTLKYVIRFASEMNDVGSHGSQWNKPGQEHQFINTYKEVRHVFKAISQDFLFCFSPALRRDMGAQNFVKYHRIENYWPGDSFVDIVSGTWYVGGSGDLPLASGVLSKYLEQFGTKEKMLWGIDEFGVSNGTAPKDTVLEAMCQELSRLGGRQGCHHATFFLGKDFGVGAPLAFVKLGA